jgi:hypothetical protein
MRVRTIAVVAALTMLALAPIAAQKQYGAPEGFTANIEAKGAVGGAAVATIQIDITRYTPEADRTAVENALKTGGYPEFLTALRKAPEVGSVSFGEKKWTIRWARERQSGQYARSIVVVTDQPMFFVGGGAADAKPRAGYEVAVIQIDVDNVGLGKGTMTAAARLKPGGENGVQVDDYAEKPIRLVTVTRKIKPGM